MSTDRKPSKNLQQILSDLHDRAIKKKGEAAYARLSNNLRIDLRIRAGIVALLISRSDVYPSPVEWRTVTRHWPYPIIVKSEKYLKKESNGCCRHYLRGYFPLQMSFLETDRTESKPVNIYAGDVIH